MIESKKCLFSCLLFLLFFHAFSQPAENKISVPVGGNSFVTSKSEDANEQVTNKGWENWLHPDVVYSTYIKLSKPGRIKLIALMSVPVGVSKIK